MLVTDVAAFDQAWMRVKHNLGRALRHSGGTHSLEDVRAEILAGRQQLWAGTESAIVTQLLQYPRIRSLELFLMAGGLQEIKQIEREIVARARASGVQRVQLGGRDGWRRALPGFRQLGVCLIKDI